MASMEEKNNSLVLEAFRHTLQKTGLRAVQYRRLFGVQRSRCDVVADGSPLPVADVSPKTGR